MISNGLLLNLYSQRFQGIYKADFNSNKGTLENLTLVAEEP